MKRYIDLNLIGELIDSHGNVHYEDLQNLPTADVVEVVRCKDCRYGPKSLREGVCVNAWCGMWCKENDFCSYAERRSGI